MRYRLLGEQERNGYRQGNGVIREEMKKSKRVQRDPRAMMHKSRPWNGRERELEVHGKPITCSFPGIS